NSASHEDCASSISSDAIWSGSWIGAPSSAPITGCSSSVEAVWGESCRRPSSTGSRQRRKRSNGGESNTVLTLKSPSVIDTVQVVGRSGFMDLEQEWNDLVVTTQDEPFYRHEFLRVWMDHFTPGTKLEVLTTRDPSGKLAAVFPLM